MAARLKLQYIAGTFTGMGELQYIHVCNKNNIYTTKRRAYFHNLIIFKQSFFPLLSDNSVMWGGEYTMLRLLGCNVIASLTGLSLTGNSWMLRPLFETPLGRFIPKMCAPLSLVPLDGRPHGSRNLNRSIPNMWLSHPCLPK